MTALQDITRITLIIHVALVGIGATLVMDAWLAALRHLGVPTLNFAFIGRWAGHLLRGTVAHPAMGAGLASRKTPTPWRNSLRSLASHTVFGLGLYLAAVAVAWRCPVA